MARHLEIVRNHADRVKVARMCMALRPGSGVEFSEPKRTKDQNRRLHAMVDEFRVKIADLRGVKVESREVWKARFIAALRGVGFITGLDDQPTPYPHRSSEMDKGEISDLMEFIAAWAAEQGVELVDPTETERMT